MEPEEKGIQGAMSPETEDTLEKKLKFKNAIAEIVDKPLIRVIDDKLLHPLVLKLPADMRDTVRETLAIVIEEMEPIEI